MALPLVTKSIEADCIVTAMFLGLAREIVGNKKPLTISASKKADVEIAAKKINAALKTLPIKNIPDVKTSATVDWKEGSYITGKQHGKGLPGSIMAETINYQDLTYQQVKNNDGALPHGAQYVGNGAYTGMLIVDKVAKYVGSTFQMRVKHAAGIPINGGKLPGMEQDPAGGVQVGYVHGMIQAIYAAAASGFKGITIEVAAGEKTKKLASCFGCTTFMYATDRPPDALHLGQAASWAPVDEKNEWAIGKLNERFLDHVDGTPDRSGKLKEAVAYLNKKWAAKCATWLHYGTTIDKACVSKTHQAAWIQLCLFATKVTPEDAAAAFLNALGQGHEDDFVRIQNTLEG